MALILMVSLFGRFIECNGRNRPNRQIDRQTHTHTQKYCNPPAHPPRVNKGAQKQGIGIIITYIIPPYIILLWGYTCYDYDSL